jgi:prevent-host-death family protein
MKTANIATAKNNFSRLIELVKAGETIVITDRDRPVARLQPLVEVGTPVATLVARGVLSPPSARLDVTSFLQAARPFVPEENSLAGAVIEEREEGR